MEDVTEEGVIEKECAKELKFSMKTNFQKSYRWKGSDKKEKKMEDMTEEAVMEKGNENKS